MNDKPINIRLQVAFSAIGIDFAARSASKVAVEHWKKYPRLNRPYYTRKKPINYPICSFCKKEDLENYFTSKRDGRVLCKPCFSNRVEKQLAKEVQKDKSNEE